VTYHVPFLKKAYSDSYKLAGAELGVFEGEGAVRLCNQLQFSILYLVDPYLLHKGYDGYSGYDQAEWNNIEERMKKALHIDDTGIGVCNGQRVKHLKMMSVDAAKTIDDAALDFVYIDANHAYEYVKLDLETWYDKVKPGGWVMGHDWPYPTVQQAVNEFMAARNIHFHPDSGQLHGTHDWWFRR